MMEVNILGWFECVRVRGKYLRMGCWHWLPSCKGSEQGRRLMQTVCCICGD